jgi:hypothetical protein
MVRGAVEFVVVGFDGTQLHPSLASALRAQVDKGVINIIDLLFLQKGTDGLVRSFELDEVEADPAYAHFQGVAQEIDGLIAPTDVEDIGEEMPPGTTALIVLFEHAWLRDLRAAVEMSGGRLLFSERIPGEVVEAVAEVAANAA